MHHLRKSERIASARTPSMTKSCHLISNDDGMEDNMHEHIAILPVLVFGPLFHNSSVKDDWYAFISWMSSCKHLEQKPWRLHTSLQTFHRTCNDGEIKNHVQEHVSVLSTLLSELFFHISIVQDDWYTFVSWMSSCKQLKQTSWRMYTTLRTFHRTWRHHVSARYAPSGSLCFCDVCDRGWIEQGWICTLFYRRAMWF